MWLPEGPDNDEIFDQTQKPNKGPSIRRPGHHIGHTGGYKEIKKAATNKWKKSKQGALNLFVSLPQVAHQFVCLFVESPGQRVCRLSEEEVTIDRKTGHKMSSLDNQ